MIDNPNMSDPLDAMLMLAEAMGPGGPSGAIEAQEKRAQQQLVHSDRLPVDTQDTDDEFVALGFTFGEPDPRDPIFRPATLPKGWSKQASDHDMWSYIVDSLGRRRVGVFFKGAWYDRSANMRVQSVYSYVQEAGYSGTELIPDDAWATPEAIAVQARAAIKQCDEFIEMYGDESYNRDGDDFGARQVAKHTEQRGRYAAMVARFDTTSATPDGPR